MPTLCYAPSPVGARDRLRDRDGLAPNRRGVAADSRLAPKLRPGDTRAPQRSPIAQDVIAQAGEVVLARDAVPGEDPAAAAGGRAAAQHELPVSVTPFAGWSRNAPRCRSRGRPSP